MNANEQLELVFDPYSILKVDRDATEAMIQSAYKNLSRTFHPDKHAPGPSRDAAQEIFVKFKNAHEILTDPVLRQVYDDHGIGAIQLVKITLHSPDELALYPTLLKYHKLGQKERAQGHMARALQTSKIEKADHEIQIRTTMEFPCSTQSTAFLGEGKEAFDIPELREASISVAASAASNSNWDMAVNTSTDVSKGKGTASSSISVGYKPHQGTRITSSLDVSNPIRFSVGSSRTLTNRTMITATARSIPNSSKLALSLASHRNLWQNKCRGTWALGFGSDLSMHFGLLSLTTLSPNWPTCTAKFNVGVNQFPLKFSMKQDSSDGKRTANISIAYGPAGMECKGILSRPLTSYAYWSMGIKHATFDGLSWLLQMERGDFTFRVPISVSSVTTHGYSYKLVYLCLLTILFDEAIGDIVHDTALELGSAVRSDARGTGVGSRKSKTDAYQQAALMRPVAQRNMQREIEQGGLVIYQASYFLDTGPSVDVTAQLQFWVNHGELKLPAGSKCHLLGFHNILYEPPKLHRSWIRAWGASNELESTMVPQLKVRYAFADNTYEITIWDTEELVLPSREATLLGRRSIVR